MDARSLAKRTRALVLALLCLAGLAVNGLMWGPPLLPGRFLTGDFMMFYAAAQFATSHQLYDPATINAFEQELHPHDQGLPYNRLPYYALLFVPLRLVSYRTAVILWWFISVIAVVAFILIWPGGARWRTLAACCWSAPVFYSLARGQDTLLVLFAIGLVYRSLGLRRDLKAGLLLSLCVVKFHLFVTAVPFGLARRLWGFLAGGGTGVAMALALSFAVQGWDWPFRFVDLQRMPVADPYAERMPTLHGLLVGLPGEGIAEVAAALLILASVGFLSSRSTLDLAFCSTLAGGILVGHHAYFSDLVLILPVALLLADSGEEWLSWLAWFVISPLSLLLVLGSGTAWVPRFALLVLYCGIAVQQIRQFRAGCEYTAASGSSQPEGHTNSSPTG